MAADSNDAQSFYQKGLNELQHENWFSALVFFQKAREKNPQDADICFRLGCCYGNLGHYQNAMESFKQAIKIKPDDIGGHFNLGLAYLGAGDKESALEEYEILKTMDADKANELLELISK